MALIEVQDFPRQFVDNYPNDAEWIADQASTILENICNGVGGIFNELARNFATHRNNFINIFCKAFDDEVYTKRIPMEDAMPVVVEAISTIMITKMYDIRRDGDNIVKEFVDSQFANNPILQELNRGGRSDNETVRRSSVQPRSGYGGQQQRYPQRHQQPQRQGYNGGGQVQHQQQSGPRYKGVLNKSTEAPPVNQQQQQPQTPPEPPKPQVADGSVITSNNVKCLGLNVVKPAYIIGVEQIVIEDGKLNVHPYNGSGQVDYELHRIDRFYEDYLPNTGRAVELTRLAIKEVEKTRDNAIRTYIEAEGEEPKPNPKLFNTTKSFQYDKEVVTYGNDFDPICVRQDLTDQHGGNFNWWNENALKVKCKHHLGLGVVSNDVIDRINIMLKETITFELVKQLVELVGYIDTAVWRKIHDFITTRFNIKMITSGLTYNLDSITSQWSELTELLAKEHQGVVGTLANCTGMLDGLSAVTIDEEGVEKTYFTLQQQVVYIPINTFDFELGVVTTEDPIHILPKGSMMFNMVSKVVDTEPALIVTLDGCVIGVEPYTTLVGRDYVIRKA